MPRLSPAEDFQLTPVAAECHAAQTCAEHEHHHLFDEPAAHQVASLADKAKRWTRLSGWMDPAAAR